MDKVSHTSPSICNINIAVDHCVCAPKCRQLRHELGCRCSSLNLMFASRRYQEVPVLPGCTSSDLATLEMMALTALHADVLVAITLTPAATNFRYFQRLASDFYYRYRHLE